jgi:hypothetical protein
MPVWKIPFVEHHGTAYHAADATGNPHYYGYAFK